MDDIRVAIRKMIKMSCGEHAGVKFCEDFGCETLLEVLTGIDALLAHITDNLPKYPPCEEPIRNMICGSCNACAVRDYGERVKDFVDTLRESDG